VSLHGNPIVETAQLPDGREAWVRVGIAEDSYVPDREISTVVLELRLDGAVAAVTDTILEPAQVDEARRLAERVVEGLRAGTLEPTARALEPLADAIL
jgi:hypothetical protein